MAKQRGRNLHLHRREAKAAPHAMGSEALVFKVLLGLNGVLEHALEHP